MASWPTLALPSAVETLLTVLPLSAAAFSTNSGASPGSAAPSQTTVTSTALGDLSVRVVLRAPPTSAALVVVSAGEARFDLPLPPAATDIALLAGGTTCALRTHGQLRVKLLFANAAEAQRLRAVLSAALAQVTAATVPVAPPVGPVARLFPLATSAGHGSQVGYRLQAGHESQTANGPQAAHGSLVATVPPSRETVASTQPTQATTVARLASSPTQPALVPAATQPTLSQTPAAWPRPNGFTTSFAVAPPPLTTPSVPTTAALSHPAPGTIQPAPTPLHLGPTLAPAAAVPDPDPVQAALPSSSAHAPAVVLHAAEQVDVAPPGALSDDELLDRLQQCLLTPAFVNLVDRVDALLDRLDQVEKR
ncbi:hypothetical protein GGF31_001074 [Allomyces arbusculus]|nr:hypothetical protein GGF31_001074 [Allomyces arbusculus]